MLQVYAIKLIHFVKLLLNKQEHVIVVILVTILEMETVLLKLLWIFLSVKQPMRWEDVSNAFRVTLLKADNVNQYHYYAGANTIGKQDYAQAVFLDISYKEENVFIHRLE